MRSLVVAVFALFSFSICAIAQNASQLAAQQAMEAAQQANQQAIEANQQATQAAQQANDDAMRANRQAMEDAQRAAQQAQQNQCCIPQYAAMPSFSLKTGKYAAGTIVRLKDSSRGATMYYTTDGWTPTIHSMPYTGPITLTETTTLQAIAVAPYLRNSFVSSAVYTVPGWHPVALQAARYSALAPGTRMVLMFTANVSSKVLQIGDTLPVALAQDLVVGGVVVAPKLTPVLTTVMEVDNSGAGGAPGNVKFAAHSLTLTNGETIPLAGTESKTGQIPIKKIKSLIFVPVVGMGALFIHGTEARIPKGAMFTAYVRDPNSTLSAKTTQAQPPAQEAVQP